MQAVEEKGESSLTLTEDEWAQMSKDGAKLQNLRQDHWIRSGAGKFWSPSHDGMQEAPPQETLAETARVLEAKRSLIYLSIQRAPPGVVPGLMQGIAGNSHIKHLDLSDNALDPPSIAKMARALRKGHLAVLILHGIRVVKAKSETPLNALAVQDLLRSIHEAQCKLEVLELMLHPVHRRSLGDAGMRRLAGAAKAAFSQTRSLRFAVVGVLRQDPRDEDPIKRKAASSGVVRNLAQAAMEVWNLVVPCSKWHDGSAASVMARHELDDAGSGSTSTAAAYLMCEKMHRCVPTVVGVLLRKLPPMEARDMRVLLEHVLSTQAGLDSEALPGSGKKQHTGAQHLCVVLDSLGITDADIRDYMTFFKLGRWLILRDNPIGQRGLEELRDGLGGGRRRLRTLSRWLCLPCCSVQKTSKIAPDSKDTAGIDRIDLLMSAPIPAQMVLRLAAMAIDPDNTLSKCTIKGAVFTSADDFTPNSDSPGQAAEAQYKEVEAVISSRDYGAVLDELFVLLQQHKADEFYKLLQERRGSLQS
jgi:hypothetical protein